jgi:4-hydroxythreonine-4-phosphate dehydrogenase
VQSIEKAVALARSGAIDAIATAPISKEAINQAGSPYPGHTEMLAALTDTKDYTMMLVADKLRVVHVTTHVSMRRACELMTPERVLRTIRLAHRAAQELGAPKPKVAVAGLNAHAGEGGLFGREEIEGIAPAIEAARKEGIDAYGPLPPDTVFLRASRGQFDIVVAMYHDQGHIPIKMLGFEAGVNATVGLPIIRTSVDHGTAYGRAGQGRADPTSMIEAIKLAVMMARARKTVLLGQEG